MKKVIPYIVLFGCLFYMSINVFDIGAVIRNPEDYKRVYKFGNSEYLQFQSVSSYIAWRIAQCLILIPLLVTLIRKVLNKPISMLMKNISYVIVLGFVLWYIYYYWMWYKSGYDHYPGFDPYLFKKQSLDLFGAFFPFQRD